MSLLLALAMQVATQPNSLRHKVTPASLNAIADRCHAPRAWLTLRGRQIVFRGNPDADPVKIECVLKKMSAAIQMNNAALVGRAQASGNN
ncbi:hypothetical protein D9601_04320 [Sphingomonas sp. MA1305]|uniref:hypothetical protein n=1 Tax=Sphingomonas sp. MA1305 TaxID=2479204 RepID=UPI0018DF4339|nr:hypothetical protein [Sphingomonas sp. MA1305]MBI0474587.1 hypothetical protein [Sphingomonas sp. MA1305]